MSIEKEMYGSSQTSTAFEKYLDIFPEGFLVAIADEEIVGFIIVELTRKITVIPKMHEPEAYHRADGKIVYVSGFGVRKDWKVNFEVGKQLYQKIIQLAIKRNCRIIEVICDEKECKDLYELKILKQVGLLKYKTVDWEVAPNKICTHSIWIMKM